MEPFEHALRVLATPTPFEGEDRSAELKRWAVRIRLLVPELEKLATPPNPDPWRQARQLDKFIARFQSSAMPREG